MLSLHKLCRLCIKTNGDNDVTGAPVFLQALKCLYDIEIKPTDKYSKMVCKDCISKVQEYYWHKQMVTAGQEFFTKRVQMAEQMNHLQTEAAPETERAPEIDCFPVSINKQENGEVLEDQMTEVMPDTISDEREREQQSQSEQNVSTQPIEQNTGNNGETETIATPISTLQKSNAKTVGKRRLSIVEASPNGEAINKANDSEAAPKKTKRIRLSENKSNSQNMKNYSNATTKCKVDLATKTKADEEKSPLTSTPVSTVRAKSQTQNPRKKTSTPSITQFFAQKLQLECDKCAIILKTQNELTFHKKTHEKGHCSICMQPINTDIPKNVEKHMISCLFLNNKLSGEILSRFFKMKVNLERLTPEKIERIQKDLNDTDQAKDVVSSERAEEIVASEEAAVVVASEQVDEVVAEQHEVSQDLLETSTLNESSIKDGISFKKLKQKKTYGKCGKKVQNDGDDDFKFIGNRTIALNWNDDTFKDKPFSLRNFESDSKMYVQLQTTAAGNENALPKVKIAQMIQKINALKQKAIDNVQAIGHTNTSSKTTSPIFENIQRTLNGERTKTNASNLPQMLSVPIRQPFRNRAMSEHFSAPERNNARAQMKRRQSLYHEHGNIGLNASNEKKQTMQQQDQSNLLPHCVPLDNARPPQIITTIHNSELLQNPQQIPIKHTTLKVLTPDDVNLRAINQTLQTIPRMDTPKATENKSNLNNNQTMPMKRPRTKMTPLRAQHPTFSDIDERSISVSLTRIGNDHAELSLTVGEVKINYDSLTPRRKQEVQSSLLKNGVWEQMLDYLKEIRPTKETLGLFAKILPTPQRDNFFGDISQFYPNMDLRNIC